MICILQKEMGLLSGELHIQHNIMLLSIMKKT